MCLRDLGIGDNDGGVGRVKRARRLSNNNGIVVIGRGIDNASEGSETTTEAARIRGQRRRLRRHDVGPEKLVTTTEALAEEDNRK